MPKDHVMRNRSKFDETTCALNEIDELRDFWCNGRLLTGQDNLEQKLLRSFGDLTEARFSELLSGNTEINREDLLNLSEEMLDYCSQAYDQKVSRLIEDGCPRVVLGREQPVCPACNTPPAIYQDRWKCAACGATGTVPVIRSPSNFKNSLLERMERVLSDARGRVLLSQPQTSQRKPPSQSLTEYKVSNKIRTNERVAETLGQEAQEPRESRKKPVRRNQKYKTIDQALQKIAESRPCTQEEVFKALEGRVVFPPAEPFETARGWIPGFRRDKATARAWLSKRWGELDLPPLPRGPKNPKK
jgi:hypothetical protein